jgi:hypothetical protein
MRAIAIAFFVGAAVLAGCETPATASATKPAAETAASETRCERREVTGSRLARCDTGPSAVRAISREALESTGLPTAGGPAGGSGGR